MRLARFAEVFPRRAFTVSARYERRRMLWIVILALPLGLLAIYMLLGTGLDRVLHDDEIARAPLPVVPTGPTMAQCRGITILSRCTATVTYEADGVVYQQDFSHIWFGRVLGTVPMDFVRSAEDPTLVTTRFALEHRSAQLGAFWLCLAITLAALIGAPLAINRCLRRIVQIHQLSGRVLRLRPAVLLTEARGGFRFSGEYPLILREDGTSWVFYMEPVEYRGGEPRIYLDRALRRLDFTREERRLLSRAAR